MDASCANHSAAPAVAKCMHCEKPLCDQCIHYHQSSVYCSSACAGASEERGRELHRRLESARGRGGFLGGLVRLAIAAAVVLAILDYLDINLPYIPDFF